MLHNKANSSSWAHFGHDSHTNQKEKIFLTLQIPLGSGRRWHILHWVQVPSELLRSSLDGSTIQSYPESTSLGISAGWSWFVGMYIAPTSNILSSWDWLSSHFGDSQGPPTAEWGLKESTSFPSDKISWNRTRSPGGWKQCQRGRGPGFMTGPTAVVHSYLQDTDLSVDESCWSQRTSWRKKTVLRCIQIITNQKKHSSHTHCGAFGETWLTPHVFGLTLLQGNGSAWYRDVLRLLPRSSTTTVAQLQQGSRYQLPFGNLNIAASMENDVKNDGYP
jgi:hypothetical protein